MSWHGTALRCEGISDEEIAVIRNMEIDKINLSDKEKGLFILAMKSHADPHSITDEDFVRLREAGATDQEIVEIIEVVCLGDCLSRFADTLNIGPDPWLTYKP